MTQPSPSTPPPARVALRVVGRRIPNAARDVVAYRRAMIREMRDLPDAVDMMALVLGPLNDYELAVALRVTRDTVKTWVLKALAQYKRRWQRAEMRLVKGGKR